MHSNAVSLSHQLNQGNYPCPKINEITITQLWPYPDLTSDSSGGKDLEVHF